MDNKRGVRERYFSGKSPHTHADMKELKTEVSKSNKDASEMGWMVLNGP